MKDFLAGIGGLILIGVSVGALLFGGYFATAYFAPKYEAVRRDVMIETRSYSEGTIRELYTLQRQYLAAKTDEERTLLAAAARHEFSIFPRDRLPGDLRAFLTQVGG